ncbi:MAG TPA: hypothetical protein VK186_06280 [Candidatus Deferrimicrobium sp.]|nr:hypothetical protein [Candidatus Deferrimicrobium sp.]
MNKEKKGKTFKLPHTLVLIYMMVITVYALSWVVPSGEFQREEKVIEGTTRNIPVPGSFRYIEKKTVGPEALLLATIQGFRDGAEIIAFLFVISGAFMVIQKTGTIDMAIKRMADAFAARPRFQNLVIPVLMVVFSLAGAIFGMCEETIPFILVFIPLAISMGYDSIVGVSIPFLGAAAGFAAAFFNPFTVGIAQGLSGLPIYSGLTYRLLVWVIGTVVIITFVMLYARKVKKNPKSSPVYELDRHWVHHTESNRIDTSKWSWRNSTILAVFGIGIVILILGVLVEKWYIMPIAALFLALGIVSGFLGRMTASEIAADFVSGAKDMMNVAFIIACGRALLAVAQDGKIMDTLLFYASNMISGFPRIMVAQMMFATQSAINFFIHSGTAQATLTMPIMAPLSDLVGVTRQTAVLAFQLCEFVNPILPTSGVTMAVLGVAKIPWEKWAKWFLPLMIILIILSFILLIPPVLLNWN